MTDIILSIAAIIAAVAGAFLFGRRDGKKTERTKQRKDQLERERKTGERIDDELEADAAARAAGVHWADRLRARDGGQDD